MSDVLADDRLTWFLSRSTGVVCLVLLTISMLLGVSSTGVDPGGSTPRRQPRFVTQTLHRNTSLVAVVLLVAHIVAVVLDDFVVITWTDAVVPFLSDYRTLWLGLGTVASDLLLVLVVSSLARRRFGLRAWRALHWTAYACWPFAVVHGIGTGTDTPQVWSLVLTGVCVLAVVLVVCGRIVSGWPRQRLRRSLAALVVAAGVVVLVSWTYDGPLAPGWSGRASPAVDSPAAQLPGTP